MNSCSNRAAPSLWRTWATRCGAVAGGSPDRSRASCVMQPENWPVGVSLSADIEYRSDRPAPYRARVRWVVVAQQPCEPGGTAEGGMDLLGGAVDRVAHVKHGRVQLSEASLIECFRTELPTSTVISRIDRACEDIGPTRTRHQHFFRRERGRTRAQHGLVQDSLGSAGWRQRRRGIVAEDLLVESSSSGVCGRAALLDVAQKVIFGGLSVCPVGRFRRSSGCHRDGGLPSRSRPLAGR